MVGGVGTEDDGDAAGADDEVLGTAGNGAVTVHAPRNIVRPMSNARGTVIMEVVNIPFIPYFSYIPFFPYFFAINVGPFGTLAFACTEAQSSWNFFIPISVSGCFGNLRKTS